MDRIINFSKLEYRYQIFLLLLLLSSMSVPLTIFRNSAPQPVKAPVQAQEMQNMQETIPTTTLIPVMFNGVTPGTDVTIIIYEADYEITVQTDPYGEQTLIDFPNRLYPDTYQAEVYPVGAQMYSFPLTVTKGMGQEEVKYQFVSQINSHQFIPADR